MITVNKEKVLNTAKEILLIDSPSGFCYDVMDKIQSMTEELGYAFEKSVKSGGVITVPGKSSDIVIGLSAHVDTLGAMVRSISSEGTIKVTLIG